MQESYPLAAAPLAVPITVAESSADPGVAHRLSVLGLRGGQRFAVQARTSGGGRILAVGAARVAISRELLQAVRVRPVAAPQAAAAMRP